MRSAKKAKALFGDQVDTHVGDLEKPRSSLAAALAGIDATFLVSDGPDLDARDRTVAFAAKSAGVRHVVKVSTLDVHTGVGLGWSDSIRDEGVLRSSTGRGKIAFIHPDDIGDVATTALTTRDQDGQSLVITGPEASYGEMAATIGVAIGKKVGFEEISDKQTHASVVGWAGKGPYADALVDIWRAVREGQLDTVSDGVKQVIGRRPISFHRWAEETAAAFQ